MPKLPTCAVYSRRHHYSLWVTLSLTVWPLGLVGADVLGTDAAGTGKFRTFTNSKRRQIEAKVVAVDGEFVTVQRRDGRTIRSRAAVFSAQDQSHFRRWVRDETSRLNEALRLELFEPGKSLWSREAGNVARQLGIPQESSTRHESSFRAYWMGRRKLLGARVYSIALLGGPKKVRRLAFVFANKGDAIGLEGAPFESGEQFAPSAEEVKRVRSLIANEGDSLRTALTDLLGKPVGDSAKDGGGEWQWNGHRFSLRIEEGEYVSLLMVPPGKHSRRVSLTKIRKRTRENVSREPNGDVLVRNIPVVFQGPKRYCVPAVFERCLRYLEIPADMYELAASSGTTVAEGTMIEDLLDAARGDIRRGGGSIKVMHGDPKWENIEKHVGLGLPLVWAMHATPEYRERIAARSESRAGSENIEAWKDQLDRELKKAERLPRTEAFRHVVLIVGYNRWTREIAISDTTRRGSKPAWLSLREALEITQPGLTVISPF